MKSRFTFVAFLPGVAAAALALTISHGVWAQGTDIAAIQAAIEAQGANWTAGETSMTALTDEEFRSRTGLLPSYPPLYTEADEPTGVTLAAHWDWRDVNGESWVSPIRDQATCGSCWAFATVAALETTIEPVARMPGINHARKIGFVKWLRFGEIAAAHAK